MYKLLGYKPGPRHRAARHAAGHHLSVQRVRRRGQRVRLQTGGRQRGGRGQGKPRLFIFTAQSFWVIGWNSACIIVYPIKF